MGEINPSATKSWFKIEPPAYNDRLNEAGPPPRINQLDALALDQELLTTLHNYLADSFKFFLKSPLDYVGPDFEALLRFVIWKFWNFDLFAAGSETSSTTLRWALIYLTLNPKVQARCQAEVDKLGSRCPTIADMADLPYCQATINEVLRISRTAPGSLMHVTMEDVHVNGYTLPKGTGLAANFMATHMDPQIWDNPEQFSPHRFLNEDETGLKDTPHFFPFSVGKRVCLGESLAKVELFLFFTILVKRCHFAISDTQPPPDPANCHIGITRIPDAFHCKISERCSEDPGF